MLLGIVLLAPFIVMPLTRLLAYPLRRTDARRGLARRRLGAVEPAPTAATAAALIVGAVGGDTPDDRRAQRDDGRARSDPPGPRRAARLDPRTALSYE
jgi:hypothetical protein